MQAPQRSPPAANGAATTAGQLQPLPPPGLPEGAVDVQEALSRQMQASMARLFPRLSATLPAELDAGLEAELGSGSEAGEDDADLAGWSSSSEDEGAGFAG